MRFEFMRQNKEKFSIEKMAELLEVSRSGYYRFLRSEQSETEKENQRLTEKIKQIHKASCETYGSPRIYIELKNEGECCSRKRVARLMRKGHIRAKMKKFKKKTTTPDKNAETTPNHLNQNFSINIPNSVWVSDITYIPTQEGWLYLAIVMDLFSRKIVGMSMGDRLETKLVTRALEQAVMHRTVEKSLMHHSDKGCQYTSKEFRRLTDQYGIKLSMSGKGNCYDNAVAESFFHTLKTEHTNFFNYRLREEAKASIFEYIEVFYNRKRLHFTLGYMSPELFEKLYENVCAAAQKNEYFFSKSRF